MKRHKRIRLKDEHNIYDAMHDAQKLMDDLTIPQTARYNYIEIVLIWIDKHSYKDTE